MKIELTKKAITERFMMICDEVIQAGVCKTRKEFAAAVGEHPQNLTLMDKGTRSPTLEQLARACDLYGYSPTWLILNRGPRKLQEGEKDPIEERVESLESDLEALKKHLIKKVVTGT